MDDFLIATSIPLDSDVKVDPGRGIRYLQRKYVSSELLRLCRTERPIELRVDCVDQHRIYAKFRTKWVLAQTAQTLKRGSLSVEDMLFEGAIDLTRRSETVRRRDAIRRARTLRINEANQAAEATKHLEWQLTKVSENSHQSEVNSERRSVDWGDPKSFIRPFKLEGEEE